MLRRVVLQWMGVIGAAAMIAGCGAGVLPRITTEQQRLDVARDLALKNQCVNATGLLQGYIANNMGGANIDQAVYLLGYCHLRTRDWANATVEFERLLRDYPESDSAGSAAFRLGETYFAQARPADFDQEYTHKALAQWERYLDLFPGHWLNDEAHRQIAKARHRLATKLTDTGRLYLKLNLPGPARVYFEKVEAEYSDTALLGDAIIGIAQCDGVIGDYDKAIERLRALEAQFVGRPIAVRARRERERIERMKRRQG